MICSCSIGCFYMTSIMFISLSPHITCVTSTQRWRHSHKSPLSTAGLRSVDIYPRHVISCCRFSTLTYVTFNPLFPCHGDPAFALHAASPLRSLVASRRLLDWSNEIQDPTAQWSMRDKLDAGLTPDIQLEISEQKISRHTKT